MGTGTKNRRKITVHDINEAAGELATSRYGLYSDLTGSDEKAYIETYMQLADLVNPARTGTIKEKANDEPTSKGNSRKLDK